MDALSIVMGDGNESDNKHLIQDGNRIYKEALALVKIYMAAVKSSAVLEEKRTQPRLKVSSLIKITSPSIAKEWQGSLTNISWGGVRIRTKEPLGNDGEVLDLSLPYHDGGDIDIKATIIRSWEYGGMYNTSVRFSILHPKDESRLDNLLELLLNSTHDTHRKHTRFAHRIDVTFWDIDELKSTLEDISKGGMMITMPDPIDLNESIQIQLEGTDESYSLNLRAHAIRQELVEVSGISMFQMALEFEHPTEELHSMVSTLMHNIMKKGEPWKGKTKHF